jgi:glucose-1-phosphate thymidylyltransferase
MKGIVLAGGSGTRLHPTTRVTSKQLLPVFDKPMVYYPISTLMAAGIRDVLVISAPDALRALRALLGDGARLGMRFAYAEQRRPRGIAEALLIGEEHIAGRSSALVLGDNLFHGPGFPDLLRGAAASVDGCVLFGSKVADPERYGVGEVDPSGRLVSIEEKPGLPKSDYAVTGLYLYDADAVEIARGLRPSARGELEITDVNRAYLDRGKARLVTLDSDVMWIDAGTEESLLEASGYAAAFAREHGRRIACLEEVALRMGFIDAEACYGLGVEMKDSPYGRYVMDAARHWNGTQQR